MHHFRLLCTDCQAEIVTGIRKLVHAVLHGGFRGSIEGTVVCKQLLTVSVKTLVLA